MGDEDEGNTLRNVLSAMYLYQGANTSVGVYSGLSEEIYVIVMCINDLYCHLFAVVIYIAA